MKKQTGIWLDKRIANVIHLDSNGVNCVDVKSSIQENHIGGGSRSKQPFGPMDVSSESKLLARKKHQLNDYFQSIIDEVLKKDELYVFGPAETKTAFADFLNKKNGTSVSIKGIDRADSMTMGQKIAKVKKFFL